MFVMFWNFAVITPFLIYGLCQVIITNINLYVLLMNDVVLSVCLVECMFWVFENNNLATRYQLSLMTSFYVVASLVFFEYCIDFLAASSLCHVKNNSSWFNILSASVLVSYKWYSVLRLIVWILSQNGVYFLPWKSFLEEKKKFILDLFQTFQKVFKFVYEVTVWNPSAVSKQSALTQASRIFVSAWKTTKRSEMERTILGPIFVTAQNPVYSTSLSHMFDSLSFA